MPSRLLAFYYRLSWPVIALILAIAVSSPARSQNSLYSRIFGEAVVNDSVGTVSTFIDDDTPTNEFLSDERSMGAAFTVHSAIAAQAQTDYGINRAYAFAEYKGPGDPTIATLSALATAESRYSDTFTPLVPGHDGESGSVRFRFAVTGNTVQSGGGSLYFFMNREAVLTVVGAEGNTVYFETGLLPVTFGTASTFEVMLNVLANVQGYSFEGEMAEADYLNTAVLENLAFFNSNNRPLSDVSLLTTSDTVYAVSSVAAPEPASIALLSMTAVCLIGIARRHEDENSSPSPTPAGYLGREE